MSILSSRLLNNAAKAMVLGTLLVSGATYAKTVKVIAEEPGGGWYTYGTTFSKIISENTDGAYTVDLIPRGGGMTNPVAVNNHKADFGFATSNASAWAKDGLTDIYKGRKNENLRSMLNGLQEAYTMVAARKEWVEKTGNDTLEKIMAADDVVIATSPTGSQVPIIADFMFKALGSDLKKMRDSGKLIQIGGGQMSQMLRDKTIDVFIENVPANHPSVTEMTLTTDVVYIPFPTAVLNALSDVGLPTGVMKNGTYKGQTEDYINPVSASVFTTSKDVDDETVYRVTKALVEGQEAIKAAHAPLRVWNPEKTAMQSTLPLHPGAQKYYAERGWLK
ncbi:TAXI family TRAP transporter solute-binding subunit [Vibrio diazotrophicus]|uniref:TAXI family TRAP transporter solute-binding subunit n=1 Tax=Vibrio diazotrophicus TaxID=685 RepID=UPI0006933AAA|nr:TAXI family TRAP transporter solute-binding subunit [Vibrio diazotrophicus]